MAVRKGLQGIVRNPYAVTEQSSITSAPETRVLGTWGRRGDVGKISATHRNLQRKSAPVVRHVVVIYPDDVARVSRKDYFRVCDGG
jgi:hypothetical protein